MSTTLKPSVTPELTATLRRLEGFGLVHREVIPAVPLHVEYTLTNAGLSALEPVFALREWAEEHGSGTPTAGTISPPTSGR